MKVTAYFRSNILTDLYICYLDKSSDYIAVESNGDLTSVDYWYESQGGQFHSCHTFEKKVHFKVMKEGEFLALSVFQLGSDCGFKLPIGPFHLVGEFSQCIQDIIDGFNKMSRFKLQKIMAANPSLHVELLNH